MVTAFLLLAQYGGAAVISISLVCRDYCSHLTPEVLIRKISVGGIALPLVRIEASQKAAKGVHLVDLARWFDDRVEDARREYRQRCGRP
ncbi:pyocin activator PrtN family protein [Methylobacterium sp. 17Sr1-1]|uniref:pyocin activator PrtN family protein n=1 Tax=Methylobacterium sp. 17Sr1-1 TaxID=2202826 RepID=UPI000D6FF7C5|nr:pyocin activator PrtN family protein [Methylobacterium sp. 17Sr1-1]AWN51775.1 Pyocin activator protein PrtN [Methylobacterium sp. 17Sr1-1]